MNDPFPPGPRSESSHFTAFQTQFLSKRAASQENISPWKPNETDFTSGGVLVKVNELTEFNAQTENNTEVRQNRTPIHLKEYDTLLPFVKKFVSKLKNAAALRPLAILFKSNYKNYLKDKSYTFPQTSDGTDRTLFKYGFLILKSTLTAFVGKFTNSRSIKKYRLFFKTHNTVLDPYQNAKVAWDVLHLGLIVFWFFYIPLVLAFKEVQTYDQGSSLFTTVFLLIDIILSLNTAYFKNGVTERKRIKIYNHYCQKKLMHDILAMVPIMVGVILLNNVPTPVTESEYKPFQFLHISKFLFFVKLSTGQEICDRFLEKFLIKEKLQNIIQLLKTFCISIFVAHIFACFWYIAANLTFPDYHVTWLSKEGLIQADWDTKYMYAFYWASITMMTVGYGDITPQNQIEVVVCILSVVMGCVVYAYNISNIGMILQDLNKEDAIFNHKITIINQFMIRKNIRRDLQRRIREYLRFLWKEENTQNLEEETKIIAYLSSSLREELLIEAYGSVLQRHPMFYANFSEKTLRKIVPIIKEVRFFPEETIESESEEVETSIFFVMKGRVELYYTTNNNDLVVSELEVGTHFGEKSFFTGNHRKVKARSKDFTTLFSINRNDFIKILEKNPDDYDKFCMIRDHVLLYNNCAPMKLRCFCCSQTDHLVSACSLVHFLPDKEKVIKKHTFYEPQLRYQEYIRKNYRMNAFKSKSSLLVAHKKAKEALELALKNDRKEDLNSEFSSLMDLEDQERNTDSNDSLDSPKDVKEVMKDRRKGMQPSILMKESAGKDMKIKRDIEQSIQIPNESSYDGLDQLEHASSKVLAAVEGNRLALSPSERSIDDENHILERKKTKRKTMKKRTGPMGLDIIVGNSVVGAETMEMKNLDKFEKGKKYKSYFPEGNMDEVVEKYNRRNMFNALLKIKERKKRIQVIQKVSNYTLFSQSLMKTLFLEKKKRVSITKKRKKDSKCPSPIKKEDRDTKEKNFFSNYRIRNSGNLFTDFISELIKSKGFQKRVAKTKKKTTVKKMGSVHIYNA